MKKFDLIDYLKIIFALLVVSIHSRVPYLQELGVIAVPFFFVATSYFLFKKLNKQTFLERRKTVIQYISRMSLLYLTWSLIYSPFIIINSINFHANWKVLLCQILTGNLPGFVTAWYLVALILGIPTVLLCQKQFGIARTLAIGMIIEIALIMIYSPWAPHKIAQYSDLLELSPLRSIIYISLGAVFATPKYARFLSTNLKKPWVWVSISACLLAIEYVVLINVGFMVNRKELFMLPAFTFFLFWAALNTNHSLPMAGELRFLSTFLFLSHIFVRDITELLGWSVYYVSTPLSSTLHWATSLAICLTIGLIILKLKKKYTQNKLLNVLV